jgi:hypothetical protein
MKHTEEFLDEQMWITTNINGVNTGPRYTYTVCHESWKRTFTERHGGWEVSAMVLNNQELWHGSGPLVKKERWTKKI